MGRALQDRFDQQGRLIDDMLAIVEDDQYMPAAQMIDQCRQIRLRELGDAQGIGDGGRNELGIRQRREIDEAAPVREAALHFMGDGERHAGLPEAAASHDRREAVMREMADDVLDDRPASHQPRQRAEKYRRMRGEIRFACSRSISATKLYPRPGTLRM